MDSLRRVASGLNIPERTLRRAASEGLIRGERTSPRRFQITLREESYVRTHWELLRSLRAALRTEPNVSLAVLFGSTATGDDDASSDIDVLVSLRDPDVRRLASLSERVGSNLARDVQLVRLSDAELSPALMFDVLDQGRVLVDRDDTWSRLQRRQPRWRSAARREQGSSLADLGAVILEQQP